MAIEPAAQGVPEEWAQSLLAQEHAQRKLREISALYDEHFSKLLRYIAGLTYNSGSEEAFDIVQETFVKLWEMDWVKFRDGIPPRAYIFRIATNRALDFLSRRDRLVFGLNEPDQGVASEADGPEDIVLKREQLNEVMDMDAVLELDPRLRIVVLLDLQEFTSHEVLDAVLELDPRLRIVVLLDLQKFTLQEIAEITNVSKGTVKNWRVKAHRILRGRLRPME